MRSDRRPLRSQDIFLNLGGCCGGALRASIFLTSAVRDRRTVASYAEGGEDGTHLIGLYHQGATTPHSNYSERRKGTRAISATATRMFPLSAPRKPRYRKDA